MTGTRRAPTSVCRRNRQKVLHLSCVAALVLGWSASCSPLQEDAGVVAQKIRASEELILELTPRLGDLTRDVLDLELPRKTKTSLFADRVQLVDLAPAQQPNGSDSLPSVAGRSVLWTIEPDAYENARESLSLWRPFLDSVDYFEHATFYFIRGRLTESGLFETHVGFDGLARTHDGFWQGVHSTQRIEWKKNPVADAHEDAEAGGWRISAWHVEEFDGHESGERMFRETLDWALMDPAERRNARRSLHEEHVVEYYETGALSSIPGKYRRNFRYDTGAQHPGLSVVDVDRDGFDDFYVMTRWGRNQFYRNQGDGTFREVADDLGLDIEHGSSSGIFGDFDNDGDLDLVLGRTLEPSMYLVNEGGVFVDRTATHVDVALPYLVASVSAADYNGDGLLDVYLSTYGKPRTL